MPGKTSDFQIRTEKYDSVLLGRGLSRTGLCFKLLVAGIQFESSPKQGLRNKH